MRAYTIEYKTASGLVNTVRVCAICTVMAWDVFASLGIEDVVNADIINVDLIEY